MTENNHRHENRCCTWLKTCHTSGECFSSLYDSNQVENINDHLIQFRLALISPSSGYTNYKCSPTSIQDATALVQLEAGCT